MTRPLKIAFVKARWHHQIVDQVQVGFEAEIKRQGRVCNLREVHVPGALEMPLVAKKLAETGNYDGIVCAALVESPSGVFLASGCGFLEHQHCAPEPHQSCRLAQCC